jgi:hypothetical protein
LQRAARNGAAQPRRYKRGRVIIARDLVINWFSTGDGNGKEETMVRAIAKSFD